MVASRRAIDLEGEKTLAEVLRVVQEAQAPVELRKEGQVVAIVSPPDHGAAPNATPQSMLEFAGWLRDDIPDDFEETNTAARSAPPRSFDWK